MGTSNLLEPALPAILIHKDESDGGSVTGPGAMAAGKAGSQPAGVPGIGLSRAGWRAGRFRSGAARPGLG
jgi:hypothetical protein